MTVHNDCRFTTSSGLWPRHEQKTRNKFSFEAFRKKHATFHGHFWKTIYCWTEAFGEPAVQEYIPAWNGFLLVLHCYKTEALYWLANNTTLSRHRTSALREFAYHLCTDRNLKALRTTPMLSENSTLNTVQWARTLVTLMLVKQAVLTIIAIKIHECVKLKNTSPSKIHTPT